MKSKFTKTQIARSILCLPFFPCIVFAGMLIDDLTDVLDYYYPYFRDINE